LRFTASAVCTGHAIDENGNRGTCPPLDVQLRRCRHLDLTTMRLRLLS